MSTVRIARDARRIVVTSPIGYKDALASVHTRQWDPRKVAWNYAASPMVAAALVRVVEQTALALARDGAADEVIVDPLVTDLVTKARNVALEIDALMAAPIIPVTGSRHLPWRHQFIGRQLILLLDAVYLAWEMGTGKTKATIDAMMALAATGRRNFLIVCPAAVVDVWKNEFAKHCVNDSAWFVISASRDHQVKKRVAAAEAALRIAEQTNRSAVIVTNYESFILDSSPFLKFAESRHWDMLVCDEAHRLATPGSKTTRAMTDKIGPLCWKRVCLSGTPMRNSPLDLYSQCKFLDPGLFGSNQKQFLERYAQLDFFGSVIGMINTDELAQRFCRIAHRVDKRSVLDLPKVTHTTRRFQMTDEGRRIYDAFEQHLTVEVGNGSVTAANGLVKLLRAQQMTSGYVPTEDEEGRGSVQEIDGGKAAELHEWMDEIRHEEPVVVFCRFTRDIETVGRIAAEHGRVMFELSGRKNELADWQKAKGGDVIAVNIKSGGAGVDLTRSCYMGFYSVGFSLADYDQAVARCDRHGQTRPVTVTNFIASGTVDEAVFGSIGSKKNVVEGVLDYLRGKKK